MLDLYPNIPGFKSRWFRHIEGCLWPKPNKVQRLARLLGRKIVVGTLCGKKKGRLIDISRDHIVLRQIKRKKALFVSLESICWFTRIKRRKKRKKSC